MEYITEDGLFSIDLALRSPPQQQPAQQPHAASAGTNASANGSARSSGENSSNISSSVSNAHDAQRQPALAARPQRPAGASDDAEASDWCVCRNGYFLVLWMAQNFGGGRVRGAICASVAAAQGPGPPHQARMLPRHCSATCITNARLRLMISVSVCSPGLLAMRQSAARGAPVDG